MEKRPKQNHAFCANAPSVEKKTKGKVRRLFRPLCIVLSSPSGGGKTTLCQKLLKEFPGMVPSVSCTTRAPRPGEKDGKSYFFITVPEFQRRLAAGYFLESARVHDAWYGTPKQPIADALRARRHVLLAIDVQGVERIRALISGGGSDTLKRSFVDIFVVPPSLAVLKQRLEGRGQDTEETIRRRLAVAGQELACRDRYKYVIVNDRLEEAYQRLKAIIEAEQDRRNPA